MLKDYLSRIEPNTDLEDIFEHLAVRYNIGKYLKHKLITVGYEDFNVKLTTDTGNYFVKIFSNLRTPEDIQRYVSVIETALSIGVKHPKLFKINNGESLYSSNKVYLLVMEWLDGNSYWDLKQLPTRKERDELIKIAATINSSSYNPKYTYDSWSITNFEKEYEENKRVLSKEDNNKVVNVLREFKKLNLNELPHCFVHGDLISTNVMRTTKGLYVVDFSVANYYPRIQELAVILCNLFYDENNISLSKQMYQEAISHYSQSIQLEKKELNALPIYLKAAHSMHIIPPSKLIAAGEDSSENHYWLNLGRSGLENNIF